MNGESGERDLDCPARATVYYPCMLPSGQVTTPLLLLLLTAAGCRADGPSATVRIATFNASLYRDTTGALIHDLSTPEDSQAMAVAEIIQRVRPDVLLINEFDYDRFGRAAALFQRNYLGVAQNVSGSDASTAPLNYPYWFFAPVNTGVPSGFDLDNDGQIGTAGNAYAGDALGFGRFPGQYGMLVLSRFPIDTSAVRTFRMFRWRDMPNALLPVDPSTGDPWYATRELDVLPLSSKSHWDLPVLVDERTIHVLASHPTPPVFDGPEDRNGRRNHDEIRFWADYVTGDRGDYLYDDAERDGGLGAGASFVILGDMNADPHDGGATNEPMRLLLESPAVNTSVTPTSSGGAQQTTLQGGANQTHRGRPEFDTADFADRGNGPGNLRLDYVLPSADLLMLDAGVFWPLNENPLFALVGTFPFPASDHRLVWVDIRLDQ